MSESLSFPCPNCTAEVPLTPTGSTGELFTAQCPSCSFNVKLVKIQVTPERVAANGGHYRGPNAENVGYLVLP